MDAARAISCVVERIEAHGLGYPTDGLIAAVYEGGWCVYAPAVVETGNPMAVSDPPRLPVFLVDWHGGVEQIEDPDPETLADAILWRTATLVQDDLDTGLPAFPQVWGPRRATDYDRQVLDALAKALAAERNFADWLARQLAELADLLGGSRTLIARRSDPLFNEHVKALADECLQSSDGPREAWRMCPSPDPASLPAVDTTGWLLTAIDPAFTWLEAIDLEAETGEVTLLAETVFNQLRSIPRWLACGIVEYCPQLIPIQLDGQLASDLDEARRVTRERPGEAFAVDLGTILLAPSPGDPDVEALLRLAVDAQQRRRGFIALDLEAAAAYRRVLDRFGLSLDFDIEA